MLFTSKRTSVHLHLISKSDIYLKASMVIVSFLREIDIHKNQFPDKIST
ncbi:protein of unknown function [Brevefilum fermentans]|uniref:Uncharacterized protein n=1 Tax=Candidatus Brevifilum fermentans TaxID=1986204 RepID=A0A1Y6K4C3_9CHLR|nr:protein of unknown function [Brevefilum fermentans]